MENICSINDAMNWLACSHEIKDKETLSRALNIRQEIYKRLLADNRDIAEHFYYVSLQVLETVKNNFK